MRFFTGLLEPGLRQAKKVPSSAAFDCRRCHYCRTGRPARYGGLWR